MVSFLDQHSLKDRPAYHFVCCMGREEQVGAGTSKADAKDMSKLVPCDKAGCGLGDGCDGLEV